jgi:hypothetical protein
LGSVLLAPGQKPYCFTEKLDDLSLEELVVGSKTILARATCTMAKLISHGWGVMLLLNPNSSVR